MSGMTGAQMHVKPFCTTMQRRNIAASAAQEPARPFRSFKVPPKSRRGVLGGLALVPAIWQQSAQRSQAYDLEKAKAQKEERKAKLADAAQEAKEDGKAVETDALQSERTVPEGQVKSVRT
jgi:hypothetical protein